MSIPEARLNVGFWAQGWVNFKRWFWAPFFIATLIAFCMFSFPHIKACRASEVRTTRNDLTQKASALSEIYGVPAGSIKCILTDKQSGCTGESPLTVDCYGTLKEQIWRFRCTKSGCDANVQLDGS